MKFDISETRIVGRGRSLSFIVYSVHIQYTHSYTKIHKYILDTGGGVFECVLPLILGDRNTYWQIRAHIMGFEEKISDIVARIRH